VFCVRLAFLGVRADFIKLGRSRRGGHRRHGEQGKD
jgi:hypothetical protein